MSTMSRALRRIAQSPFSEEIERIEMLRHFTRLLFTCYNGKTDPVEHVSHFTQLMVTYSRNDVQGVPFQSPTMMRWFNSLKKGSIHSSGARFVTCSRKPQPINTLLSMAMGVGRPFGHTWIGIGSWIMRSGETTNMWLRALLNRGYPLHSKLRDSLTMRTVQSNPLAI